MRLALSVDLVLVPATLTSLTVRFDPEDRFNLGFKPLEPSRVKCKAELLLVGLGRGIFVELLLKRPAIVVGVVVALEAVVDPDLGPLLLLLDKSTSSFFEDLVVATADGRTGRLETLLTLTGTLVLTAALSPLCVLLLLLATVAAALTILAAGAAAGFNAAGTTKGIFDCSLAD